MKGLSVKFHLREILITKGTEATLVHYIFNIGQSSMIIE